MSYSVCLQALYVFQLAMDSVMGQASLTSITEYLLTQPILSFVVSGHTPFSLTEESGEEGGESEEEEQTEKEFDNHRTAVVISLHCIHTR